MATITLLPPVSGVDTQLSGGLQDALVEALVLAPDPRARSTVICTVIQETGSIVECLADMETPGGCDIEQELTSLQQLAAAHDHRLRMTFVVPAVGMESRR